MVNRIILNETSYFGPGSRKVIAEEVAKRGYKKALVITDKDLVKFGVAAQVTDVLKAAGIPYEVFDNVKQNPTVRNVKAGIDAFKAAGADFIVAIGGGSSIDTSKAVGIIVNNPEFSDVVSLEGVAPTKKKSVPVIALPTTAGTAAEVTINYVITDEENEEDGLRRSERHPDAGRNRSRADAQHAPRADRRYRYGRTDACHRRTDYPRGLGDERYDRTPGDRNDCEVAAQGR